MNDTVLRADLTWTGSGFEKDVLVGVSGGRITSVGRDGPPVTKRLSGCALIPGFVNAHSHAFQRGLRGKGETFEKGAGSFWTWREAMYELVSSLDGPTFIKLCTQAFREMRAAGITTVGEFHYFHHPAGEISFAYDDLVLQAAGDAGIRIVLLNAFYKTGGIKEELGKAQQRFSTPSIEMYWKQMDVLQDRVDGNLQTLGVVAHSIRAVPLDDLSALHAEASARGLPFHMHLEEQPKEIEECLASYGRRPMAVVLDTIGDDTELVAVHCTHSDPADIRRLLDAGGNTCVCPLTEANLGDGIPDLALLSTEPNALSLGSDSNARISMVEEARWLEYGQRWANINRGVLVDGDGSCAARLINIATSGGAAALGINAGTIAPGAYADFAVVDLNHPALEYTTPDTLGAAFIFGAGSEAISEVCVGGRWASA